MNAWAMPEKFAVIDGGRMAADSFCTAVTAVPIDTPGAKSNEIVTDGI